MKNRQVKACRFLELVTGIEPATCSLRMSCSAIEPHQRINFNNENYYTTYQNKNQGKVYVYLCRFDKKYQHNYFVPEGIEWIIFLPFWSAEHFVL